jgi:hypothetical protein
MLGAATSLAAAAHSAKYVSSSAIDENFSTGELFVGACMLVKTCLACDCKHC